MATRSTTSRSALCDRRWSSQRAGCVALSDHNGVAALLGKSLNAIGTGIDAGWQMQDQSLRLWNIKTRVIAAVMNGEGGHCNEVLSIVRACHLWYRFRFHSNALSSKIRSAL